MDTQQNPVAQLIENRKSVRAFLNRPVERLQIEQILTLASKAPSGGNMQPWQVHVVTDGDLDRLSSAVKKAYRSKPPQSRDDYTYYPVGKLPPYTDRIAEAGADLYASVDIGRRDIDARRNQQIRNYEFHGAPVGLILTMDDRLQTGSYVDMGIFISHILLAAESMGLATCAEASFISYADAVRTALKLPASERVICGIALGYADWDHPINQYERPRQNIDAFVNWHGTGPDVEGSDA